MKKAQSAIEFIAILGVVLFMFLLLMAAVRENISSKTYEKDSLKIREIASMCQQEIVFASETSNGYVREFEVPEKMNNREYTIEIADENVYARTNDGRHAISFPISAINGDLVKGTNTIKKINNEVYLNV